MESNNWENTSFLSDENKLLLKKYFKDIEGKYKIENDILYVNIDNIIEKFVYIKEHEKKYYNIEHDNIRNIHSIAILVQIGNWDVFLKMESYLSNFNNINHNIYFTIINNINLYDQISYLKKIYENCVILSCENKGMDIGPFLLNLDYIKYKGYNHEYLFKIHTKTFDEFRNNTLNNLIGSHEKIIDNIQKISDNDIGIISGNIIYKYNEFKEAFLSNYYYIKKLVKYFYNEDIITDKLEFCAGTMFIFKNKIFDNLNNTKIEYIYNLLNNNETLDYHWYSIFYSIDINNKKKIFDDYKNNKSERYCNNLNYNNITNKPGLRDAMIEHAFERFIGYMCNKSGLRII
jgi:hypothetical protein